MERIEDKNKSLSDNTGGHIDSDRIIDPPASSTEMEPRVIEQAREIKLLKAAWDSLQVQYQDIKSELDEKSENLKNDLEKVDKDVKDLDKRTKNTELRSIEIIGIISAVIALVLVFVETANAQTSLENSFFVLITATAALVIFVSLIHYFFNTENKNSYQYYIASLIFFLIIISLILVYIFFLKNNLDTPSKLDWKRENCEFKSIL